MAVLDIRLLMAAFAFVPTAAFAQNGSPTPPPVAAPQMAEHLQTLDMFEELEMERRIVRIMASPPVVEQQRQIEKLYSASSIAKFADGKARLALAAQRSAMGAVEKALFSDPGRPKIKWAASAARHWYGIDWPGTGTGGDNPDNFYRHIILDGQSRYEISGRRIGSGPQQTSFVLYARQDVNDAAQRASIEGAKIISVLEKIATEPDGSFMITVGPEAGTSPNHIQTAADAETLIMRDTLSDWATERPNQLRVVRVSGPPAPPLRSDEAIANEAIAAMKAQSPYWLKYFEDKVFAKPANTIASLGMRPLGWGMVSLGWFDLKDDEALVVQVDPVKSVYLGFQICDSWSVTPDYAGHSASLSQAQAKLNADGTYTYVVARTDPRVWNWVDTVGMRTGMFIIRWQGLAQKSLPDVSPVRSIKVVKIADLKPYLPQETKWVSAEERAEQQRQRSQAYASRFGL